MPAGPSILGPGGPPLPLPHLQDVPPPAGSPSISFQTHANLAYSTVATAPSPADTGTTMVLGSDSSTFPSPTAPGALPYSVTVWPSSSQPTRSNSEIVTFTALDPGTLTATIVRAQEGSTARTIIAGDQVSLTHTLRAQTDVENAILTLDSRAGLLEQQLRALQAQVLAMTPTVSLPSRQLDYVVTTGDVTSTAASAAAAVTCLQANPIITDGATSILIAFSCAHIACTGGAQAILNLFEDGVDLGVVAQFNAAQAPLYREVSRTPSAGTHTYSLRMWTTGGATGTFFANPTTYYQPSFMRISRA